MFDFTGQTALVTGASRGIGLQIAQDLHKGGAHLILTSTREEDGRRLKSEFGENTKHFAVDFSEGESTRRFLTALNELPELHVCINNAGLSRHRPILEIEEEDWDITLDVNLKAPLFVAKTAAQVMSRNGGGRIVNITSIWGHATLAGRGSYTAAKYGLRGLTTSLAAEFANAGILVNAVAPGFTLTDMVQANYTEEKQRALAEKVPMGRLADTAEISSAVLYFASRLNTYATGQSLVVDGGYTIL